MPVIKIREERQTEKGFEAVLQFDSGEYPITITDPFTSQEEKQLEWYFEDWVTFPFSDISIAERAAASVKTYGERLFEQVFKKDFNAYGQYQQLRGNLSQVQIEIVGKTPEFQALHWEALHDPDLTRPLAVDCVMVRKSSKPAPVSANVQPSALINLLIVVARPDEEKDVGYRTISRPMMEVIENGQLRVNVELLRPGTYEALSRHLEEKGAGFYHVIHLDMHGALMSYEEVQEPRQANRYFYKGRYGRDDLQKFDGVKAFVCFEGETQGKVDLVEASELAGLLTGKGIPVCILNACQSGKQVKPNPPAPFPSREGGEEELPSPRRGGVGGEVRETSLGSRLMTAGMQMVVAMGYSVTVSAAKLMMEQLYKHLFDHKPISEAIRLGRRELFNDKERKASYNKFINLEDWLLPVVYSNQAVQFNLRTFTPEEEEKYWETFGSQYRFPLPEYGFVGRDLEILKIEKALLRHNILLLQGMGGTGKTTLLSYLREWWQRTNFVKNIFYFGYDLKAWTLTQILFDIGTQVYSRFEQASFQAMSQGAQVQKLVAKLRAESYALILDNLESVTGQQLAIQNTLPEEERNQIRDFIGRLVGGKTRVVLGSRSREEWLQATTFKYNIYELQGLDREARSELAEKILERNLPAHKINAIRQDADFIKLMDLLAGYPLAMEVVLGNLQRQSPQQILQGLQGADVNLDVVSEDKTKSILKCVEYSHSNLSEEAQNFLLCLAPFSGFIDRRDILNYVKKLQELEPFKTYQFNKFDDAIQEAINWGLLSPIDLFPSPSPTQGGGQESPLLRIQPVFPYFLKSKLVTVDAATRKALQEGFKNHYLGLANSYNQLMQSKDAQERQLGIFFCRLEYENLHNGLQLCLDKQESIDIFFCLSKYFTLKNDIQEKLKLSEFVCKAQESYPDEVRTGEIGLEIIMALDRLASCYLQTQDYQQARKSYQKNIESTQKLNGVSENQIKSMLATTYHQLGIVAQKLREYEEARRNYQLALAIYIEFGDRYSQARTYHNLGYVAQELREYEEARRNYQLALAIYIEFGDRYSQASTYHQLGYVAQELREYEEARRNYQLALAIYIEFGDRYEQAGTYHNLGIVAQELREYEEAQRNYQQALAIYIEFGDRYEQAGTYHNLGIVAQELREYEEARRNYQLALAIFIEFGDRYSQASAYHNVGIVAQNLREYEEARRNYQLALAIKIEFGDRYSQASTYGQLGLLAGAQEDYADARVNLQKALEIFVEYKDEYSAAMTRRNLERLPD
ncbi:Tfp pilus assembly protein PilF [Cylindrospermum stagnale PCC 7417]|uniref:Tfp pilus assembly protein PilF n=1 Tax=Cylindrospermum stagnale PCC 7417 TaxID=56107 RepID=K9WTP5_9NOST|nr:tetratricopeptide repeat protein [Cylindrospermum stagnale]AFZ23169.1 Tfp pilus assembly protein PilF [Cylindrospermum stagnale PCC 7417]